MLEHLKIPQADLVLHELLGTGSFGAVHRGTWSGKGGGRTVAIKQVRIQGEETIEDLCKELNIMASIRFTYICSVHGGCVVSDFEVWFVLDYINGGNLHDFLTATTSPAYGSASGHGSLSVSSLQTPIAWEAQLTFAIHAALAVNYLHNCSSPLLHRDIKSHNFLVQDGHTLYLTDFGLSKTKAAVTRQTATIGTLNWAAPEILKEEPEWSEKADVYSLGMVLYEIVAREIPYKGVSNLFVLHKKIKNGILPTIPVDCPGKFADIIRDCWQKDPAKRPSTWDIIARLHELEEKPLPNILQTAVTTTPQALPYTHPPLKKGATLASAPLPRSPSSSRLRLSQTFLQRSPSAPNIPVLASPTSASAAIQNSGPVIFVQSNIPSQAPPSTSPMCTAASCGDVEAIKKLVASGACVNITDELGRTPLHLAAEMGHTEAASELVRLGHADMNATNDFGETPLQLAAERGHFATVTALVGLGADVNGGGTVTRTPLHLAAEAGHVETVRELIRLGGKIDACDDVKRTPLHWAADEGHIDVVRELIRSGADVRLANSFKLTSLHLAAKRGHLEVVRDLVALGAPINATCHFSGTALHMAADKGHTQVVKELVQMGALVDPTNQFGKTPLQLAAAKNHKETVALLKTLTADAMANNSKDLTPAPSSQQPGSSASSSKDCVIQ